MCHKRPPLAIGASDAKLIFSYLLPSFLSHTIAELTLSIPGMILGETALSFIGLGLQPPATNPDAAARKLHLVKAGESPAYGVRPGGGPFHPRCPYREPRCEGEPPALVESGSEGEESHLVACHLHRQLSLRTFAD